MSLCQSKTASVLTATVTTCNNAGSIALIGIRLLTFLLHLNGGDIIRTVMQGNQEDVLR